MPWIEQDQWEHVVTLRDGSLYRPHTVVLNSTGATGLACVFIETRVESRTTALLWIPWDDIESVVSKKNR